MNSSLEAVVTQLSEIFSKEAKLHAEIIVRAAMEWAYRDAAGICRVKDGTEPRDIIAGQDGFDLCNALADAIEARLK